jgi:hypothetical protein
VERVHVAVPVAADTLAHAGIAVPSWEKATVPAVTGAPPAVTVTAAEYLTLVPNSEGLLSAVTVVVVGEAAALIVYGRAAEVDPPIIVAVPELRPVSSPAVGVNTAV